MSYQYTANHEAGLLRVRNFPLGNTLEVVYSGGYPVDELPFDLERAMWGAFVTLWNASNEDTGGPPPTGGSGVITGSGDVKSITVFDGFKLDYDVGTTSVSAESGAASDELAYGWLAPWASTLAYYRAGQAGAGLGCV